MKTKTYLGMLAVIGWVTLRAGAQITVDNALTNGLFEPHSVAVGSDSAIYISDSANNRVVRFEPNTGVSSTLAGIPGESGGNDGPPYLAHFNSPQGLVLATVGGTAGVIIADTGNHRIRFVNLANGSVSTIAGTGGTGSLDSGVGTSATFRFPIGLTLDSAGILSIADSKNNAIRQIDLNNPSFPVTTLVVAGTTFREPNALAAVGTNQLWVADTKNHAIKLVTRTSATTATLTTLMGSNDQNVPGSGDNIFGASARFNSPRGLLWLGGAGLVIGDTGNQTIRLATNNPVFGATNYGVITLAGVSGQSGYVNGAALAAKFSGPHGLARDSLGNGFLVADTANSVIRRIQTGAVQPPVASPLIGWVDFPPPLRRSVLRTDAPFVFNNDVKVAIMAEQGTETFFTLGPTPASPVEDTIPSPSRSNGASPPPYVDGLFENEVAPSIIAPEPDVTIKAIGTQDGRISSPVVQARFQFKVGNPIIYGNNAANFTVDEVTQNAVLWYTLDGVTDPAPNGPNSIGPVTAPATISLNASSDLTFKVRAFRSSYKDSDVVTRVFSTSNFIPTRISFGLTNGEPSSKFLARPGQFFYAPVTLQLQPEGETMYSLQFNVAVTNGLTNPNTGVRPPAIQNGAGIDFASMLMSKVPPGRGDHYPPNSGQWYLTMPPFLMDSITNQIGHSLFVNPQNNVLGVGWLFRTGYRYTVTSNEVYLLDFDTVQHDLINFSIAHDTLFSKDGRVVVVGASSFQVPNDATNGDAYFIQLGSPSATREGIGSPGSSVFIQSPTNSQRVTVGTPTYLVGDAAPFHWLNAGDFGEGKLDNADVMQVFQSAILEDDMPPGNSDLFLAMDSSGQLGNFNGQYYTESGVFYNDIGNLSNGGDLTINDVAFGDGQLDVSDVFVTFRRSLDPSLKWFVRYWDVASSQFVATNTPNLAFNTNNPSPIPPAPITSRGEVKAAGDGANYQDSSALFTAADVVAAAGQTVQIPIMARVFGDHALRVLGLNITVRPLGGAPELTQQVQFSPAPALGQPTIPASKYAANYSGAWLNSSIAGVLGNAPLGTLSVTLPANCPSNAVYAVNFDHASGSPNGLISFPVQALTGLITLSDRSASSANDGIPDSWRLRYFGTVNNLLSAATADADGDGATNWQEYKAGTNPNDAASVLRLRARRGAPQEFIIRWPSGIDKQYVVERSPSLTAPTWTLISTNTGTGAEIEFRDNPNGPVTRFYRVRPLD